MNDRTLMLLTCAISLVCMVWALSVPAYGMAVALVLNAIISFVLAFRLS